MSPRKKQAAPKSTMTKARKVKLLTHAKDKGLQVTIETDLFGTYTGKINKITNRIVIVRGGIESVRICDIDHLLAVEVSER